ncbi:MAG: hypothetical protein KME04_04975 [Pleurocapsa minor GSE-CHR-MK-17-07R]|jgi:predicted lipid-binding transport protein (Tim44 family)|nr:hypothetical protein [Pleurocapsa minor GSE-CHR-MK 17-07R]
MTTPPEELRLETNYNQLYGVLGAAGLMMGIALVAVLSFAGLEELVWTILILGTLWGLGVLVIGGANHLKVLRERRAARSLFEGGAWTEWRWSPADWARELDKRRADHARRMRFQRFAPWLGAVAGLIIGGCALLPMFFGGVDFPAELRPFIFGLAAFFAVLSFVLSVSGAARERRKWARRLEHAESVASPWVRFGLYGFYHEVDGHTDLRDLDDVRWSAKKSELTFVRRHAGPRGSSFGFGVALPVPETHHADASALASRYRSERGLND